MSKARRKKKSPKRVLALPDLEQAKSAVLNSLTSKSGQRTYDHAITEAKKRERSLISCTREISDQSLFFRTAAAIPTGSDGIGYRSEQLVSRRTRLERRSR
jgi:uncharacterized protein (DUF2336 family)